MTGLWAGTTVKWKGGDGHWEDAAMWDGTLPSGTTEARLNGTKERPSQVTLARTDVLVNHLSVADGGDSLASLVQDGLSLTVSGSLDVGKYNGSDGWLVVKSGRVLAGTIYLFKSLRSAGCTLSSNPTGRCGRIIPHAIAIQMTVLSCWIHGAVMLGW
jgi:hypothetical protein